MNNNDSFRTSAWRLDNIDALRGAAAVSVLIHHVYQQFYYGQFTPTANAIFEWLGAWGVTLFFLLSGFCIHFPQAKNHMNDSAHRLNVRDFLLQRFLRLAPPYWIAIVISIFVGTFVQTNILDGAHGMLDISLHMLALHTLWPSTRESINAVFWTIGLEVHFYLFYLLFANRRFSLQAFSILFLVGLATYGLSSASIPHESPWRPVAQLLFINRFWQWYLGAWLAEIYLGKPHQIMLTPTRIFALRWAAIVASIALGLYDPVVAKLHIREWILPYLCGVILFSFAFQSGTPDQKLDKRMLAKLGHASYSLYLLHPIAIGLVVLATRSGWLGRQFVSVTSIAIAMAMAAFIYWLIERPLLSFRRKLRRPSPLLASSATATPL